MTDPEQPSAPRGFGRRAVLRVGTVTGVGSLAGCMQPLLEEEERAEANGGSGVDPDDSGENADEAVDGNEDDGVEVVDELQLEPVWDVDLFGSSVVTHDGQFITQVAGRQLTGLGADGDVQWQAQALGVDEQSYALPGVGGVQNGFSATSDAFHVGTLAHEDEPGHVIGYDADDGSTRYHHRPDRAVSVSQLTGNDSAVVYFGSGSSETAVLRALEVDGETRWTTRLDDDSAGPRTARNVVIGEDVVAATDEYELGVYDLADGSLVETIDLDPVVRRAYSSDDSVVYLRTHNGDRLTALERPSFDVAWEQDLERTAVSPTTLADGVLYAGAEGGYVHAYDAEDGTLLWDSPRLGGRIDTAPTVDGFVWVTDDLGTIYALERDDGTVRYRENYRDGVDSSTAHDEVTIAAIDETVLIGESGQAYRVRSS